MKIEQLNIEGKRSGEGFVCHRERLINALSRAQAPKIEVIDTILGRKGLLNYLKALGGSNVVKIVPCGSASELRAAQRGLKVICGANISYLEDGAWVTEAIRLGEICQVRVTSKNRVMPNLGALELAEALSRVIPFAESGKEARQIFKCLRFVKKEGKPTIIATDGYRLAEAKLDFEDGESEVLVDSSELKGFVSALKKANRVRLSFDEKADGEGNLIAKYLVIDTELISYKFRGIDGSYPDYEKVIPSEFVAEARFDAKEMLKASQSLGALYLDNESPITVTIAEGKVILEAKEQKGRAEVQAETSGESTIGVNARYLIQALKALGGMTELKVKGVKEPMLFSVDGYRVVVMPVYIPESKAVAEAEK
ncbi:MAG: DNA polymerase III subunit beta, partial [Nitrososphaerales archaeon]